MLGRLRIVAQAYLHMEELTLEAGRRWNILPTLQAFDDWRLLLNLFFLRLPIRGPFRSIEASGRGAVGNGVTPFPFWNGGVQGVPGSINLYNPIPPFQNQGFENLGVMVFPGQQNCTWPPVQVNRHEIYGFAGKCGGTGVFLPSEASAVRVSNEAGGTAGALLSQHLSVTSRKRNKSAKHVQRGEKKDAVKDEESLPNELCLPKEWTY